MKGEGFEDANNEGINTQASHSRKGCAQSAAHSDSQSAAYIAITQLFFFPPKSINISDLKCNYKRARD
jgi:hypothetical protein